jgi:hypothetical protein
MVVSSSRLVPALVIGSGDVVVIRSDNNNVQCKICATAMHLCNVLPLLQAEREK